MADRIRWTDEDLRPAPAMLVLDRSRAIVLASSLVTLVAVFQPWAEGVRALRNGGTETVAYTGLDGPGDGTLLLVLSLLLATATILRPVKEARARTLRLVPAGLAIASGLVWLSAYRTGIALVELVRGSTGGHGGFAAGLWIAGLAILVSLVVTLVQAYRAGLLRRGRGDPRDRIVVRREAVVDVAGAALGSVAGTAVGVWAAFEYLPNANVVGAPVFGALIGFIAGAWAGAWVVRWSRDQPE